jgi:rare lipoprotein A
MIIQKRIIILFLIIIILSSCSLGRRSYKKQVVPFDPNKDSYMVASWYGKDYHGKKTASGEVFDMYALTAAHKTLPFGTQLEVTNISNNKSARVTINDRGPFIDGRDIDLSYKAASDVGMIGAGIAKLRVVFLGINHYYDKYIK